MNLTKDNFFPSFPVKYFFVVCIYFALSLFGILHHEIWLDEAHHFLLARDSASLSELKFNARYDGHPLLWNILLFIITRFTHQVLYMQLLNIIFSTLAVIVFLRNAPFTDLFKLLFVFGYFMFYEYNIISRNYSISVLFLMISCSLICEKQKRYPLIFISLLFLACTHLFSLFCSFALFLATIFIHNQEENTVKQKTQFAFSNVCFVILILAILWSIIPPTDHFLKQYDVDPYLSFKRIGKACSIFFKGLFHFPNFFKYNFWNTNLLVDVSKNFSIIPSVLCFIIPFILFHNKPVSLLVFYFSTVCIAVFIFWSPIVAGVRYFGYVWMMLVISLWISSTTGEKQLIFSEKIHGKIKRFNTHFKLPFIYSILIVQVISAGIAYALDIERPFSESKNVARYLKENNWGDKMIVLSNQCAGPSVSAYLDEKLFYPETNQYGSFCKWNTNPMVIDKPTLISRLENINSRSFVFVRNGPWLYPYPETPGMAVFADKKMRIHFLTKFEKGTMKGENYWLYKVDKI